MNSDTAKFKSIIDKIRSMLDEIANAKLPDLVKTLNEFLQKWYIPNPIKEMVKEAVNAIVDATEWLIEKVEEIISAALVPITMLEYSWIWADIKRKASGVSGSLTQANMTPQNWSGTAYNTYNFVVNQQNAAAAEVAKIADSTDTILTTCAIGGMVYYAAFAGFLLVWSGAVAAAVVAINSVFGAPPGAAAAASSTGVTIGGLAALTGALVTFVGGQLAAMEALHSQASDSTGLDNGHWPMKRTTGGI